MDVRLTNLTISRLVSDEHFLVILFGVDVAPLHIEVLTSLTVSDLSVPVDVVDDNMAVHYGHNFGKATEFTTGFQVEIEVTDYSLCPAVSSKCHGIRCIP